MHRFLPIIAFLFIYVHLWHVAPVRFGTAKYTRGLSSPKYGVISPNTFTSVAPRTYSIICIGSESCLGSIVGFARLPCFGTLRSALSARVVKGELLWLCFWFIWSITSVEKAENWRSWCNESWSTTRWLIRTFRDSLRITRRAVLKVTYVTHRIRITA